MDMTKRTFLLYPRKHCIKPRFIGYWLKRKLRVLGDILYFACRYAEMAKEEKNKISHRYKSLALVKSHFKEAGYVFQTDDDVI